MVGKKLLALLITLLSAIGIYANEITVGYNENVELMSIMSRLAGLKEYCYEEAGNYDRDIDSVFASFKRHPAVVFLQEIHKKYHCSYDAIMSMALRLNRDNSAYHIVEEDSDGLDSRWKEVDKSEFTRLVTKFYNDTRFEIFFSNHKAFYDKCIEDYKAIVMKDLNIGWYGQFYGLPPSRDFRVIIAFVNGKNNYGVKRKLRGHREEVFNVQGYFVDKAGKLGYNKNHQALLIHEFNHSFINYLLVDMNKLKMQEAGQYLFKTVAWSMRGQNYGEWITMINESLVRAAVIRYLIYNGANKKEVEDYLSYEISHGFRWMPELVGLLGMYEKKRAVYPTFESFYPKIIDFFITYKKKESRRIGRIEVG